jgi:hypothetical protein
MSDKDCQTWLRQIRDVSIRLNLPLKRKFEEMGSNEQLRKLRRRKQIVLL